MLAPATRLAIVDMNGWVVSGISRQVASVRVWVIGSEPPCGELTNRSERPRSFADTNAGRCFRTEKIYTA